MTHLVSSFVSGAWTGGSGVLSEVLDPTTGAVAARLGMRTVRAGMRTVRAGTRTWGPGSQCSPGPHV